MRSSSQTLTLSGVGAPAAVLLLALGCSSRSPSPAQAPNTDLASLSVQGGNGDLLPAFQPGLTAYTLPTDYAGDPGPIQVRAVPADERATLTINGVPTLGGVPVGPIPLVTGRNLIPVTVTSPDGRAVSTTTITCVIHPRTTQVRVLDSINGVPVPGARITVADRQGTLLQTNIPVDGEGTGFLRLDGTSVYELSALAEGSAQSLFTGFDSSREREADFYCHALGMLPYPARAPRFAALAYGPDGSHWNPVEGNVIRDTWEGIAALKVTTLSSCSINPVPSTGFGLRLDVDQPVWSWDDWGLPPVVLTPLEPEGSEKPPLFRTTLALGIPHAGFQPGSSHYLDLVAYDVAKNRTETKLYFSVTGSREQSGQPDLSALTPSKVTLAFISHGLGHDFFSFPGEGAVSHELDLFFSLRDALEQPVQITGFEVFRSQDATLWTQVATSHFSAPKLADDLVYSANDPSLKEGETYWYKVRAVNDTGSSRESEPMACAFLPPFTASLVAPLSGAVATTLRPSFTFSISDPSLFDPAISDVFLFTLFLHDKALSPDSRSLNYRYDFAAGRFEAWNGYSWDDASGTVTMDAAHRTFTILGPADFLQPGASYQWSIFGSKGAMDARDSDPCQFRKFTHPSDTEEGNLALAISRGSTYYRGYGAVNGFFTLNIHPNAL